MKSRKLSPRKMLGGAAKIIMVAVVLLFLGMQSINFFMFTFPPEKWYYAYLGFGLTSGGVIAYLMVFLYDADTDLKKTISVGMMVVCVIGELATAGFGMRVEAWQNTGLAVTQDDFAFMILAVQILGLFHGIAMLAYYAGDRIRDLFEDDDGDGIPNFRDPDWKPRQSTPSVPARMFPQDEEYPDPLHHQ